VAFNQYAEVFCIKHISKNMLGAFNEKDNTEKQFSLKSQGK